MEKKKKCFHIKNTNRMLISSISYFILVLISLEYPSYEGPQVLYEHL